MKRESTPLLPQQHAQLLEAPVVDEPHYAEPSLEAEEEPLALTEAEQFAAAQRRSFFMQLVLAAVLAGILIGTAQRQSVFGAALALVLCARLLILQYRDVLFGVCVAAVLIASLATLAVAASLCSSGVTLAVSWSVAGVTSCDDLRTDTALRVFVEGLTLLGALALVIGPAANSGLFAVRCSAVILQRADLVCRWSSFVVTILIAAQRQCVLTAPFAVVCLYQVVRFALGSPINAGTQVGPASYAAVAAVAFSIAESLAPATTDPDSVRATRYIFGVAHAVLPQWFFVGSMLALVHLVLLRKWIREILSPMLLRNFETPPETGDESHVSMITNFRLAVALRVINSVGIFIVVCFAQSMIGIAWVALWFVDLLVTDRPVALKVQIALGAVHITALFVGGFGAMSDDRARYWGLRFGDDTVWMMIIIGGLLWFASGVLRLSRTHVLSMITKPQQADDAGFSARMLPDGARVLMTTATVYAGLLIVPAGAVCLFIACVARASPLHAPFLLLFALAMIPAARRFAWPAVLLYTSAITVAQYAVQAAVGAPSPLMRDVGFHDHGPWSLWYLFVWCIIFALCTGLVFNRELDRHIPARPELVAGPVFVATAALLLITATSFEPTIIGWGFFAVFLVSVPAVLATSATRPPRVVRLVWAVMTFAIFSLCVALYIVHLLPARWVEHATANELVGMGLYAACDFGVCAISLVAASALLMVVQMRLWATKADGARPAFVDSLMALAASMAVPVTQIVAITGLMVAGTAFVGLDDRVTWGYFAVAVIFSVLPTVRSAAGVWRLLQFTTGGVAFVRYCVELALLHWDGFSVIGFQPDRYDAAIYGLAPHVLAFIAVTLYSSARLHCSDVEVHPKLTAALRELASFYPCLWLMAFMTYLEASTAAVVPLGGLVIAIGLMTRKRMRWHLWFLSTLALAAVAAAQVVGASWKPVNAYARAATQQPMPLLTAVAVLAAAACTERTRLVGVEKSPLLATLHSQYKRIRALRTRGNFDVLLRFIKEPVGVRNFTERRSVGDYVVYALYAVGPIVACVVMFWYAAYTVAQSMTVARIVLLVCAATFLLLAHQLPWHATRYWRWHLRLLVGLAVAHAVALSPLCPPLADQVGLTQQSSGHCWRRELGDTVFFIIASTCSWIVYGSYDRRDFPFYLREKCRVAQQAMETGQVALIESLRRTNEGRQRRVDRYERRQRALERMMAAMQGLETVDPGDESHVHGMPLAPGSSDDDEGHHGETLGNVSGFVRRTNSAANVLRRFTAFTARGYTGRGETTPPVTALDALANFFNALVELVAWHAHFAVVFAVSVQYALNPSALNMPLPIVAFVALTVNPRPPTQFWTFVAGYSMVNITTKALVKLLYCDAHDGSYLWTVGRVCVGHFFTVDMIFQLLCIVCVVLHKSLLVQHGLWHNEEARMRSEQGSGSAPKVATTPGASSPLTTPRSADYHTVPDEDGGTEMARLGTQDTSRSDTTSVGATPQAADSANFGPREIVANVTGAHWKLGKNYYPAIFAAELFSIIFIVFAYYKLVGSAASILSTIRKQLLPGGLVIVLIVFFIVMVADRVTHIQRSLSRKALLLLVISVGYHVLLLVWFNHQFDFMVEYYGDRSFWLGGSLALALVLYAAKCLVLALGALQIRDGFDWHPCHLVVKGDRSDLEYILYQTYRVTPFVYDLGVLLEWSVVKNGLTSAQWINLNDVSHELYCRSIQVMEEDRVAARGPNAAISRSRKACNGWSLFLLLSVVLFVPLIAYSSLSPAMTPNATSDVTVTVSVPGAPTLWTSSVSTPLDATGINQTVINLLDFTRRDLIGSGINSGVPQAVQFAKYSSKMWSITPPARAELINTLHSSTAAFALQIAITITSTVPTNGVPVHTLMVRRDFTPQERMTLMSVLDHNSTTATIHFDALFNPFVLVEMDQIVSPRARPWDYASCNLTFAEETPESGYWGLACTTVFAMSNPQGGDDWNDLTPREFECLVHQSQCPDYERSPVRHYGEPFLLIVTAPVLASGVLQSIGIVAAYTTFVFAIGRIVRFAFSGGAYRVTLEAMEDPTVLINLIEYAAMTRARGEHDEERRAFKVLMGLLRVTELLEEKTRRNRIV
jgi:hypothetical protein